MRMYRQRALAYQAERVAPPESILHNLPSEETPFYGRQEELDDLLMWLVAPGQRLLTLTGLGGIGKTRLALAAARQLIQPHATLSPRFPGGVWFVSLAELEEGDFETVGETISKYCHCPVQSYETVREALIRHFGAASSLLILDNLEHLPAMPEIVSALLASIPNLTILATSRHPLKLQCETIRRLRGLPPPKDARDLTAPSVALLAERLRRVDGDFRPTLDVMPDLTRICRTLEGWPLALELAASWGDRLPLHEIADRIASNITALKVSMPDLPPRHRSIEAALTGSFTLLSPQQQHILTRFAVFRGGCTAEAAASILGASREDLALLVRRALLKEQAGRYTMHELIRQFVLDKLVHSGMHDGAVRAHAAYYLHWLTTLESDLYGPHPLPAVRQLRQERENIRTAWAWALENDATQAISAALPALVRFYDLSGLLREGDALLRDACAAVSHAPLAVDLLLARVRF
ncbi:MAG: hypothetical protein Fur0018_28010 [Anaerolineales bacterium]